MSRNPRTLCAPEANDLMSGLQTLYAAALRAGFPEHELLT